MASQEDRVHKQKQHEQNQLRNSVIVPSAISGQVFESATGILSFFLGSFL